MQEGEYYTNYNSSFAGIFGCGNHGEPGGKSVYDFFHESEYRFIKSLTSGERINNGNELTHELRGRSRSGEPLILEASLSAIEGNGVSKALWIVRNITGRKKQQSEIRESEEKYRTIGENIDEVIWMNNRADGSKERIFYTPSIYKLTGYTPGEFKRNNLFWFRIIHPADVNGVIKSLKEVLRDKESYTRDITCRIIHRHGSIVWIRNRVKIIRDNSKNIVKIVGIINDITDFKLIEDKQRKITDELQSLNATKNQVLSLLSHDLRSPFSSIIGFSELLLKNPGVPVEKRAEYLGNIKISAEGMLNLLNSLLEWTKIQSGTIKLESERFDAYPAISESILMLSGNAVKKGIDIRLDMERNCYIHADRRLFGQVVGNLLSNAIKFSMSGGKVSVTSTPVKSEKRYRFSIKDEGIGIDEETLKRLFKFSANISSEGTHGEKGSGLGLILAKEIIKRHNGSIEVISKPGEGSEFIFTFPISSDNILLVDDSVTDSLLYTKLLKTIIPGYNIVSVRNGREALDSIDELSPALIISDHQMPEVNGVELVNRIIGTRLENRPPIIILSSDLDSDLKNIYKNLGIEYIFGKPVNLALFKIAIEKSLRKSLTS